MTDNPLLDAIDALTKPDTLLRHRGTEHEHFWAELVRNTTPDERAAAKAAKRKLPRTVGTGEWWCMFCDETRDEKPDENEAPRTIDRQDDPPLLVQLEARIRSTLSDGGAPGKPGSSMLVDQAAFDLASRIRNRLTGWAEDVRVSAERTVPLGALLRRWYAAYAASDHPVGDDDRRARVVAGWVTEIRDLLDPPDQIPYRGQPCPLCGETRAIRDLDGEVTDTVALWAVLRPDYRPEGSYGMCRACGEVIARSADPMQLRARMNGAIAPATRLTATVAESAEIV